MPRTIDLDQNFSACECNVLPCNISAGTKSISSEVSSKSVNMSKLEPTYDQETGLFKASLRGRQLTGRSIDLESFGYVGYDLKETNVEDAYSNINASRSSINKVTVWSYGNERDLYGSKIEQLLAISKAMKTNIESDN